MKQINNIFNWRLSNQELLYVDRIHKQFCVYFLNKETAEKYDLGYEPFSFYQVLNNTTIIVDNGNRPCSIYRENKLQPFNMNEAGCIAIREQDPRYLVLYKSENDGLKQLYSVFDYKENRIIVEAKRPFFIVKDKALCIIGEILHCYSLDGQLNWQYDLASVIKGKGKVEFKNFIGLYEHELWIELKDNNILVLDTITGKELVAPMNLKEVLNLPHLTIGETHLDDKNGRIRILAFSYYIEIDLATRKPAVKIEFENGWVIGKGKFYDGDVRAYFTSDYPLSGKTIGNITAGVFNTETLEVEWSYTLSVEDKYHFFVGQPQANERYFTVRDTNDTLYLFER